MEPNGRKKMPAGFDIEAILSSGSQRDDLQLTFGIELEAVLAFDVTAMLEDPYLGEIMELMYADMCHVNEKFPEEEREYHMPRPALGLAQEVLEREGLESDSTAFEDEDGRNRDEIPLDYSTWNLIQDGSIDRFSTQDDVREHASDLFEEHRIDHLYTSGLELVSRVLPAPPANQDGFSHPSLEEVSRYVTAIAGRSTDSFACLPNKTCGLHVHIGAASLANPASPAMFPLDVLQHLSYILLQYETVISSLFPFHRRGQHYEEYTRCVGSNLMGLRRTRHTCPCYADSHTEDRLSKLAERIFSPDMTIDKLSDLMSEVPNNAENASSKPPQVTRYKFINFTNLHSRSQRSNPQPSNYNPHAHPKPLTLEFRQSEASMDTEEINHWILFVLALVRAAERKAKERPRFGFTPAQSQTLKYHALGTSPRDTVPDSILSGTLEGLLTLLQLAPAQRAYWKIRHFLFHPWIPEAPKFSLEDVFLDTCRECCDEWSRCYRRAQWDRVAELERRWSGQVARIEERKEQEG